MSDTRYTNFFKYPNTILSGSLLLDIRAPHLVNKEKNNKEFGPKLIGNYNSLKSVLARLSQAASPVINISAASEILPTSPS